MAKRVKNDVVFNNRKTGANERITLKHCEDIYGSCGHDGEWNPTEKKQKPIISHWIMYVNFKNGQQKKYDVNSAEFKTIYEIWQDYKKAR